MALLGQQVQSQVHLIPLQLDHTVLGAATADPGFQFLEQGLEPGGIKFRPRITVIFAALPPRVAAPSPSVGVLASQLSSAPDVGPCCWRTPAASFGIGLLRPILNDRCHADAPLG